ncbi:hypothetical protein ES706_06074 [subsurface metagenome]
MEKDNYLAVSTLIEWTTSRLSLTNIPESEECWIS